MATTPIELCVIIDSDGNYAVGKDKEAAAEAYANEVGDLADVDGHRIVYVELSVPLPECVLLTGTVPESGEPATMTVK